MRVIAGSARGRDLYPPKGNRVRPTADRVKEAIFSSLTSRFGSFEGLKVLDLFAGSGSLGIEALSRGAASGVFIDSHPESIDLIRKNLHLTGFNKAASLIMMEALKALQHLSKNGMQFDLIMADPPYAELELTDRVLCRTAEYALTAPNGILVIETDIRCELHPPASMQLSGRKFYGDTAIWLFELTD